MANAPTHDWAWPALIHSLQTDIAHLREIMDETRRESVAAREAHRRELDALIEQLREVRADLGPIVRERTDREKLAQATWWKWIERAGWAGIALAAYAVWHWVNEHTR